VRETVQLQDGSTDELVDATLFDDVSEEHFHQAETEWRPIVLEAAERLERAGVTDGLPQHGHWDWTSKIPDPALQGVVVYGLECQESIQGLMKVRTAYHRCRLPEQSDEELVYIDYLEVAPWNIKRVMTALERRVRFKTVGTHLVRAAVSLSEDQGSKGRVGLHSLPSSEGFYQRLGMTPFGYDPDYGDLLWCEFTLEQAQQFLKEVSHGRQG
jgi:hypothetical protein